MDAVRQDFSATMLALSSQPTPKLDAASQLNGSPPSPSGTERPPGKVATASARAAALRESGPRDKLDRTRG